MKKHKFRLPFTIDLTAIDAELTLYLSIIVLFGLVTLLNILI